MPFSFPIIGKEKAIEFEAPKSFDGTPDLAQSFCRSCVIYIKSKQKQFDNPMVTYLWVLSRVQGEKVDTWKASAETRIMRGEDPFGSVDNLFKSLMQNFGVIDPALKAREEIEKLRQGKDTCEEYYRKFHALAEKTGYDEEYLLARFKRGLNEALYTEVWRLRPCPMTLNGWYREAVHIDWQWRYRQSEHRMLFGTSSGKAGQEESDRNARRPSQPVSTNMYAKPTPALQTRNWQNPNFSQPAQQAFQTPQQPRQAQNPVPMDVDKTRRSGNVIKCFKCGQPGHVAPKCHARYDIQYMDINEVFSIMEEDKAIAAEGRKQGFQEESK